MIGGLAQVDTPIIAAQYTCEAFVVEFTPVLHTNLSSDGVGGGVGNGRIGVDVTHVGIRPRLRDNETRRFGGYTLSLVLWQYEPTHFVSLQALPVDLPDTNRAENFVGVIGDELVHARLALLHQGEAALVRRAHVCFRARASDMQHHFRVALQANGEVFIIGCDWHESYVTPPGSSLQPGFLPFTPCALLARST